LFGFKKLAFGLEMENPHHWKINFNVLGNFQNYKFLDNCTMILWFVDSKNSKVDRRHLYEWCGKILCKIELRWRRNGWSKFNL
jgi:hypothetical protein